MTWLNFLQKYSKKNKMKLGDAMKPASKEWKKQKKTMKVGGVHCQGNPDNILKNPMKTILPNCPRKTRKYLKRGKGEKKGGEIPMKQDEEKEMPVDEEEEMPVDEENTKKLMGGKKGKKGKK